MGYRRGVSFLILSVAIWGIFQPSLYAAYCRVSLKGLARFFGTRDPAAGKQVHALLFQGLPPGKYMGTDEDLRKWDISVEAKENSIQIAIFPNWFPLDPDDHRSLFLFNLDITSFQNEKKMMAKLNFDFRDEENRQSLRVSTHIPRAEFKSHRIEIFKSKRRGVVREQKIIFKANSHLYLLTIKPRELD